MYNKLFTKILDSSIWLEPSSTRIVWITMIAAMDELGMCQFASVANVARRAVVTLAEAEQALKCLEAPDPNSGDPDYEGRRIERVPGGWLVLNAGKYRDLVTRIVQQQQIRERVRRHRERKSNAQALPVTPSNGSNEMKRFVTPSEAESDASAESEAKAKSDQKKQRLAHSRKGLDVRFETFWQHYPRKVGKEGARRIWERLSVTDDVVNAIIKALQWQVQRPEWTKDGGQFIPHPSTWLNQHRWEDEPLEPVSSMISVRSRQNLVAVEAAAARLKGSK